MPRFQEVVNLVADALREAAEYLQLQYRKLHESEAYLSPGAVKVPRAAPESDNREHPEDDRFVQGELFSHNE